MSRPLALITGASSGIGLDFVHLFAADGYDVAIVARSEAKLREIAADVEHRFGVSAEVIVADLAQPHAARSVVDRIGRPIDALVNNAGYGLAGEFVRTDVIVELAMIQFNIAALTELTKLVLPQMVERRSGRIVNVASTAAFQPGPLMAVYYATKAYVLSFSEAIADELRDSGVTVTALCPGPTATNFAVEAGMTDKRLFTVSTPMASEKVARIGYAAMKRGKRIEITGLRNKFMAQTVRFSPRRLVTTVVRRLQEKA